MNITLNKQLIAIVIGFLAIFLGLLFGIAQPRFKTLKERYLELSQNQTKLATLSTKKENLKKLKKDEKRIESALLKSQYVLPEQKELSGSLMFLQIDAASSLTGITLISMNLTEPQQTAEKKEVEEGGRAEAGLETKEEKKETEAKTPKTIPAYQMLHFSIALSGEFKQLLDFLTISESLAPFTAISSLSISRSSGTRLDNKIEGDTYYKVKGVK